MGLPLVLYKFFSETLFFVSYLNKKCDKHGSESYTFKPPVKRNLS